jgi:hypothetical protein
MVSYVLRVVCSTFARDAQETREMHKQLAPTDGIVHTPRGAYSAGLIIAGLIYSLLTDLGTCLVLHQYLTL